MSLINIRDPRDTGNNYQKVTVVVANKSNNVLTIDSSSDAELKKLVVGMRVFNSDGTTGTDITAIDTSGDTRTVTVTDGTGLPSLGDLIFTTAYVKGAPLTNAEIDENFIQLEKNKIGTDGAQPIVGNLEILEQEDDETEDFEIDAGNLFVKHKIVAESIDIGGTGGTATLTTAGDIEANNLLLDGEIDDRSLFEKFSITRFNRHLLCEYGGDPNNFLGYTVLYLDKVDGNLSIGDQITVGDKVGIIRETNIAERYIIIEESVQTVTKPWILGTFGTAGTNEYLVKRVLQTKDYLKSNQLIKIFGAGDDSISKPGAPTLNGGSVEDGVTIGDENTFRYKAIVLNRKTGKLSDPSADEIYTKSTAIEDFDETTFNTISISVSDQDGSDESILLYRKINNAETFDLIAIIDNSLISGSTATFNDFGDLIINDWANRTNGSYVNNNLLEYIPKTIAGRLNAIHEKGYQYVRVNEVNADNTFTVKSIQPNASISIQADDDQQLKLYHDNSVVYDDNNNLIGGLQYIIDEKDNIDDDILDLPPGTYHTGLISIPNNFTLRGKSRFSTTLKLPPLDDYVDNRTHRHAAGLESDVYQTGSYSNTLIGLTQPNNNTTENNVSVENITLDGNFINRFKSKEDSQASILADSIVRAENVSRCLFRGCLIKNSIGGGIYAPVSKNLSIENCDIIDNSIELRDTEFYSPLLVIGSSDLNVTNNRIVNSTSSADASNTVRGSFVGNIIKNTNTGLVTYGSTSLITTPNLILGPANEFLGTTDVFDSEFDSINIDLFQNTSGYTSPVINFQREGENAHLSVNNKNSITGTGVKLETSIHTLAKLGQYEYFIPNTQIDLDDIQSVIGILSSEPDKAAGSIQFQITETDVGSLQGFSIIGTSGNLRSLYNNLDTREANEELIGLAYQVNAIEYTNLIDSDEHIPFTHTEAVAGNKLRVFFDDAINLNEFLIGRKCILTASGHPPAFDAYITTSTTDRDDYIELTVDSINTEGGQYVDFTGVTGNPITKSSNNAYTEPRIGFRNKFLIAKGRILV